LEAAARILRYDFLLRAAQQTNASCVAVAHTADDQAETVLLRVLRGAGLRGMRGILPKRELGAGVSLVRPLLCMTRAEILAYCAEHGLTPRLDSSNADTRFARNRVRHELLPMLATYNPSVRAVLARTATVAAGDYEIWSEAMAQLWAETAAAPTHPAGQIAFERARWLALGRAQQRALLRLAAERLAGEQDEIDFSPLEAAVTFSRTAQPGRWCELAAGLRLKVEPAQLVVCRAPSEPEADAAPRLVAGALAPGWRLTVADADPNGPLEPAESRWTVFVDSDRLTGPLELRARRRGDRFQPLGLGGHTAKLSDFFVNQKIPVQQRDGWPLVTCGNAIVWVTGLRLDDRFRVTERSRRVTRLALAPATTE
jgi:tRNA(Ile)-lysidine synthase